MFYSQRAVRNHRDYVATRLRCYADDITLNAGSGGAVLATDEDGSNRHFQLVKLVYGGMDTFTLVATGNPLPVDLRTDNLAGNLDVNLAASGITLDVSVTNNPILGASTNNIGDVDVISVVPGTGATNLGKAEDAAHTTGDVGVMSLAVRTDTPANRSGADGDYEPLQVAAGRLWVSALLDTALPAGTNNIGDVDVLSVIPGTGANNLGKAEDAAHTTADVGVMALAVRTDSPGNKSGADGDYEPLQVAGGRLWASATIDAALPAGTNNIGDVDVLTLPALPAGTNNIGDVDVLTLPALPAGTNNIGDVDVLSIVPGTGATNLGKAEDAAHTTADVGVMALAVRTDTPANRSGADSDYEPLQIAAGRLWASATIDAALPAGTNNIGDVDIASLPDEGQQTMANSISVAIASNQSNVPVSQATASDLNAQIVGTIAHDSADSGNPVKIGGKARNAHPTPVANNDRADLFQDLVGRVVTLPYVPRELITHNRIALTSTTETTLIAAAASTFRDLLCVIVSNESATEVRIDIRDSTGGTVRLSVDVAADGGGAVVPLPVPLTQATANNNWTCQLSAGVSTVYITGIAVSYPG